MVVVESKFTKLKNSTMAAATLIRQCLVVVLFIISSSLTSHSFAASSLKRRKSLIKIKEINRHGPYIGLITVYPPEENAFFATRAFKSDPKHPFVDLAGRRFKVGKVDHKKVIYVRCGIGMVNAAATTQQMLDVFEIIGIVHFGIAGNANNSMSIGDVIIPKQFVHTGLWDWLKPNGTVDSRDLTQLDIGKYNVPKGEGTNLLGHIGYSSEQFYSETGKPNEPQRLIWAYTTPHWMDLAANLQGMKLERCVNSSFCLPHKPKLVIGLKGSTANTFVDNAAYRDFLFQTFQVSSLDMESSAVVMTSLANAFPVIVIRGLSDLAGAQEGKNPVHIFGPLAASNTGAPGTKESPWEGMPGVLGTKESPWELGMPARLFFAKVGWGLRTVSALVGLASKCLADGGEVGDANAGSTAR